ncbi:ribonuclease H-like domain-containing protein, partial [Tanacetum coccineum]
MNEEKEDRISSLPDGLLLEIISLIKIKERYVEEERIMTTREVIKTSTISKRWQHLWTKLPNLIFTDGCYGERQPDYFSFIDKTLTQCPTNVNLNKFKLHIYYDSKAETRPTSQINSWIRYAITRNVQEFNFYFWDFGYVIRGVPKEFTFDDELFFNNSCFTRMKLFCCVFNPPNGAIHWDNRKYLRISKGKLDDDSLGKMLSGSPCLETLELDDCYGIRRIDFTSKRFKNLVLSNYGSEFSRHFAEKLGRTLDDIEEELLRGLLPSLGHVNEITLGDNCLQ